MGNVDAEAQSNDSMCGLMSGGIVFILIYDLRGLECFLSGFLLRFSTFFGCLAFRLRQLAISLTQLLTLSLVFFLPDPLPCRVQFVLAVGFCLRFRNDLCFFLLECF